MEMEIVLDAARAIMQNNPDGLRDAMARGADVNSVVDCAFNDDGTPRVTASLLTIATSRDIFGVRGPPHACCELLVAAGADLTCVDLGGLTPLCLACLKGCTTMVALFLAAGADPNYSTCPSKSPLLCAIYQGQRECALAVLRAGAVLSTFSTKSLREELCEARESSDKERLNNFLRLMRKNGGWEAHVKRHRALLVGRLRYWLRLPEDALGIVVDFSVLPGGS
jgi:hypothetical protein